MEELTMGIQTDILLESGTNELEVIMFEIGTSIFGINVLKVREIINAMEVTSIPNSHENVEGIIRLREQVLPVVNLAKVLHIENSTNPLQNKFIIAELNQIQVAFRVHDVSRIHRFHGNKLKNHQICQVENKHMLMELFI